MLNDAYPNQIKEWEMNAPQRFWTKEKALEALRWTIEEKEKLSDQQLRETYNIYWLEKHQLSSPVQIHYRGSPYAMLNQLYPGKFKEKEINKNLRVFKTKEEALEVLRWTIEEKEKLTDQKLMKAYSRKWLKERKLGFPLDKY
ncbi:hypothetical protein FO521_29065, partial [Bacillus pseudomycoides]|nr:hypothetical protein [Bacillus pseudomycoides]